MSLLRKSSWPLIGAATLLLSTGAVAQARTLPLQQILLTQSFQLSEGDNLYLEGIDLYEERRHERTSDANYQVAIAKLLEAIAAYKQERNHVQVARVNQFVASIYYDQLGNGAEALNHYGVALTTYQNIGDVSGEVIARRESARIHIALGEKQQALDHFL